MMSQIYCSLQNGGHDSKTQAMAITEEYIIGTLRSDNGDVHENVAEKQTSHHFQLFCDYPNSPCYLHEGDFGWS